MAEIIERRRALTASDDLKTSRHPVPAQQPRCLPTYEPQIDSVSTCCSPTDTLNSMYLVSPVFSYELTNVG
jgi:hypothetical protein